MSRSLIFRVLAAAAILLVGVLVRPGTAEQPTSARETFGSKTAAARYGWRPAVFDFGWEYGEALTDAPKRGTRRVGQWIDVTNGSGSAAQHNGGVLLQSKYGKRVPQDVGIGDVGTTSIQLTGNAQTYGRWEVRVRPWTTENNAKDYRVKVELVPADPAQYQCGARAITVADLTPRRNEVRIGAYTPSRNRMWRITRSTTKLMSTSHAFAVEVTKEHISWFVDGAIVGTLLAKAAIPKVPLTLKVSLVGDGQSEMNTTYVMMDWLRAYTLKRGTRPANGGKLARGAHNLHC
ncbi:MAG TPA: family 16 glycosylhydrolase [Nocardioidaceae bacterium]|nr:family 16 glycosylhydrolase [Nocardioidaceae bacterium]